jgi:CheY-like chemotaxis protein
MAPAPTTARTDSQTTILLVDDDASERERLARWLASDGYEVIACPGPRSPDYTCLAGRGCRCPLAAGADLVVLDTWLESDELLEGIPGWRLLDYYLEQGNSVVALAGVYDEIRPDAAIGVSVIRRPPSRLELLDEVRRMLAPHRRPDASA